jgi:hypothetical protein
MHLLHFSSIPMVYICTCFFLGQWATHPCEFYYFAGHWIFPSYRHNELVFVDVKKGMSTSYSQGKRGNLQECLSVPQALCIFNLWHLKNFSWFIKGWSCFNLWSRFDSVATALTKLQHLTKEITMILLPFVKVKTNSTPLRLTYEPMCNVGPCIGMWT